MDLSQDEISLFTSSLVNYSAKANKEMNPLNELLLQAAKGEIDPIASGIVLFREEPGQHYTGEGIPGRQWIELVVTAGVSDSSVFCG